MSTSSPSRAMVAVSTRRTGRVVGGWGRRRATRVPRAASGSTVDEDVEETTRVDDETVGSASFERARAESGGDSVDAVDAMFITVGRVVTAAACVAAAATAFDGRMVGATAFEGTTGAPSGMCGTMSAERLRAARAVMMCNQENWRDGCLANYDDDAFDYVDGPGLTKIHGKKEMERYLKNQFDFSKQFLTVEEEVCEADSYVATWRLDMLLGTGPLRNVQGISVLKFSDDQDSAGNRSAKIVYHRDYLPDGPIWENAPIVGPLVKLQRQTYTSCMQTDIGCARILGGVADEK